MGRRSSKQKRAQIERVAAPPQATVVTARPPAALPGLTLAAVAAGVAALAVYTATLNPTVSHGDSGEMIAVVHTLGVPHPPGFPLYVLLAKLFAIVPIGSVAARINFFSAVCDAMAAFFLCRATALLSGTIWSGLLAAGLFAFSPLVWPYAVTAEVFALNNLFAAALLWLSTLTMAMESDTRRARLLTVTACVFGLGLANHYVLVLLAGPALALQVFVLERRILTGRLLFRLAGAFLLGLVPYAYLMIAPRFGSPIAWGDTSTLQGFLDHVLRREYGALQLAESSSSTVRDTALHRLSAFAMRLTTTTAGLAPLFALAAVPAILRRGGLRFVASLWAIGLACHLFVFASLSNLSVIDPVHATVQERFWQQSIVVLAALAGLGVAHIAGLLPRARTQILAAAGIVVPVALVVTHFHVMDQRHHTFFRDYGRAILDSLPANAVLLITSDEAVGSVRYLQTVEGLRPDVRILPTGQVTTPWFRPLAARHFPGVTLPPSPQGSPFSARQFFDINLPAARIFLVNKVPWLSTLEESYLAVPVGLADEVLRKNQDPPLDRWADEGLASFARFNPATADVPGDGAWEQYVERAYWRQFERFGLRLSSDAATRGNDPDTARIVVKALEPLVARHPNPDPMLLRNLGVAYQFLVPVDPPARSKMMDVWTRYLAVTPPGDATRETIARIVRDAGRAAK
jgi:hypothetical protein